MSITRNIPWRSKIFLALRIFELLFAIVVIVVMAPHASHYYRSNLHKRAPTAEPREGYGGSSSFDSSSSSYSPSGYGAGNATEARYATPFMAVADAILTIIWCITAMTVYCRHTLRPKVSMFWDVIFIILWLGLIACIAIGMYETEAWYYGPEYSPSQYSVFVISCIVLLMFIWSYLNSRKAHREFGPGASVPADAGQTLMETLPPPGQQTVNPQYYNTPQPFGAPQPYNADQQQQYAPASYPQGYFAPLPQLVPQYSTPPPQHYQPPV